MSRLSSSIVLFCSAAALPVAVFFWRSGELRALKQDLEHTRPASSAAPAKEREEPADLISRSRTLIAKSSPDSAGFKSLQNELKKLPPAEFEQWCEAMLAVPAASSRDRQILLQNISAAIQLRQRPEAISVFLKLSKREEKFGSMLSDSVMDWMMVELPAAGNWVKLRFADRSLAHLPESVRETFKYITELAAVAANPSGSLETIRQAPMEQREELLTAGMKYAQTADERRALAAVACSLADSPEIAHLLPRMLPGLAVTDGFDSTAQWLSGLTEIDPGRKASAQVHLAMGFEGDLTNNIGRNADGILQHADESSAAEFVSQLTTAWVQKDHRATAEWINAHAGAPWQDNARAALARGIAAAEPADAMTWAASISEPALREETAKELFAAWRKTDAARSAAFLRDSALPEELKRKLETGGE